MKKFLIVPAVLMGMSTAMGQNYNGKVVDADNQPVPYANVVMMSLPDSAFVCGTVSDVDGNFALECNKTGDLLRVSSIGFQNVFVNRPSNNLGVLILPSADNEIAEVEVKAQKPKTRLTGNSMVTSITGSVLEKSGTAQEMLAKVPGMMQGKDGLEVIGKGSPVYYINGRKVQDLEELKRLQSDEIKEVEVITNPGAQYDATVSCVVRIRTVRRQGNGFGFDLHSEDCYDIEYGKNNKNGTVNLRYRHKNVDVFGLLNYWDWNSINVSSPHQWTYFRNGDDVKVLEQDVFRLRNDWYGQGLNYNLGVNWQISDNHSVGVRVDNHDKLDGYSSLEEQTDISEYLMGALKDAKKSKSSSYQCGDDSEPYNLDGNAYYNGKVGKLGIDFNFDFMTKKSQDNNMVDLFDGGSRSTVDARTTDMLADKLVLSYPVWKGQLTVGEEMSFVLRKSDYAVSGLDIQSTSSKVREDNLAVFAEYGFQLEKLGAFTAGLRYEHVGLEYTSFSNPDNSVSRNNDNVFPSASWSRQFGQFQTSLSYRFKVQRPNYWSLNEAMIYVNPYSYQQGDPKLKNQNSQNIDANIHWKVLNLSMSYGCIRNSFVEWSYVYNEEGVIVIRNINLDEPVNNFSAFLNASPTFGVYSPNWTVGLISSVLRKTLADPREASDDREICYRKPLSLINCNNAFRLKGNWQLEANMYFQFKGDVTTYRLTNNVYNLNFVVQKSFLKDNSLVFRLTLDDALRKSGQDVSMDCGYYYLEQSHHRNSQRLNVSVRYTFNKSQSKYKGTGAGSDAKERM